jgi:tetraacyldisaccharide 4'-kinase
VFCGVARPHKFVEQLHAAGVQSVAQKFYRDHHRYTEKDIRDLLDLRDHSGADGFISTQKDAINLGKLYARLAPITFPPVNMELIGPADALDSMLRVISERSARA